MIYSKKMNIKDKTKMIKVVDELYSNKVYEENIKSILYKYFENNEKNLIFGQNGLK